MKKITLATAVTTLALVLGLAGLAVAASDTASHDVQLGIPEIALIRVVDTSAISFTLTAPATPGDKPVEPSADTSKRLQYTSILPTGGGTRSVTAAVDSAVPSGLTLKLTAGAPGGWGNSGTSDGEINLSTTAQSIISGIGSCFTGIGGSSGSQLTYDLDIDDSNFEDLTESTTTLTVTFTLTEAS